MPQVGPEQHGAKSAASYAFIRPRAASQRYRYRSSQLFFTYICAHGTSVCIRSAPQHLTKRSQNANRLSASTLLHLDSSQLPGILADRQWSYFSFLPSRFGHAVALDDAFRCLITAAHSLLVPNCRRSDEVIL